MILDGSRFTENRENLKTICKNLLCLYIAEENLIYDILYIPSKGHNILFYHCTLKQIKSTYQRKLFSSVHRSIYHFLHTEK